MHYHPCGCKVSLIPFLILRVADRGGRDLGRLMTYIKKRGRPLDDAEHIDVELGTRMDVEILHDVEAYALRWPTSPLSREIMNAGMASTVVASPCPPDSFGALVAVPKAGARSDESSVVEFDFSHIVIADSSEGDAAGVVTPPDGWCEQLGIVEADATRLVTRPEYRALCDALRRLDEAAVEVWRTTPLSLRGVTSLPQAMSRSDVFVRENTSPQQPAVTPQQLWLSWRKKSSSALRPWGLPLSQHCHIADHRDEYFICNSTSTTIDPLVITAKPWLGKDGTSGSRASIMRAHSAVMAVVTDRHRQHQDDGEGQADPPLEVREGNGSHAVAYVTCAAAGMQWPRPQPTKDGEANLPLPLDEVLWFMQPLPTAVVEVIADTSDGITSSANRGRRKMTKKNADDIVASANDVPWERLRLNPALRATDGARSIPVRHGSTSWHIGDLAAHQSACDACFDE